MAEKSPPTSIRTYHCLCTTLILSTTHDLHQLPRRDCAVQDGAIILAPPLLVTASDTIDGEPAQCGCSVLVNTTRERKSVIIRRGDGFEKRSLFRCTRCNLVVGYGLDEVHWENGGHSRPIFLLPGGLLSTMEMVQAKKTETPKWAEQK